MSNTPCSTVSHTPYSTVPHTPYSTVSYTPYSTVLHTPCNIVSHIPYTIKDQNNNLASSIDGDKCNEDFTNVFYGKYNPLYNSVPYNKDEMNDTKCGIEEDLLKKKAIMIVITVADL